MDIPPPPADGFFTYLLECADGTFYVGWTTNLARRLQAHNQGRGARYTRGRRPVTLQAFWAFPTRVDAMAEEYRLKQLSRSQKQRLAASFALTSQAAPTQPAGDPA